MRLITTLELPLSCYSASASDDCVQVAGDMTSILTGLVAPKNESAEKPDLLGTEEGSYNLIARNQHHPAQRDAAQARPANTTYSYKNAK